MNFDPKGESILKFFERPWWGFAPEWAWAAGEDTPAKKMIWRFGGAEPLSRITQASWAGMMASLPVT